MSSGRVIKSRRPLRYEFYSLMSVLAIPAAIAVVFPYAAIGFTARPTSPRQPSSCVFVSLTDEQYASALANSRSAWKVRSNGAQILRADLSVAELPAEEIGSVLEISNRRCAPIIENTPYKSSFLPQTLAAPAAAKIERDSDQTAADAAFPRSELLQID